mmetsp:Transcript_1374/g.2907  ORF Transcript_1374/g.2907 Transcript_1374/m.2907 type:complete len:286 (-) Transcript_1374:298-1155(-)
MGGAEARSAPGSLLGRSRADHGGQFHGSRFCHVMFVTFRSGSELAWLMGICEVGEVRTGSLLASKEAGIGRSWEARCSIRSTRLGLRSMSFSATSCHPTALLVWSTTTCPSAEPSCDGCHEHGTHLNGISPLSAFSTKKPMLAGGVPPLMALLLSPTQTIAERGSTRLMTAGVDAATAAHGCAGGSDVASAPCASVLSADRASSAGCSRALAVTISATSPSTARTRSAAAPSLLTKAGATAGSDEERLLICAAALSCSLSTLTEASPPTTSLRVACRFSFSRFRA